jgi:hypothetical protein
MASTVNSQTWDLATENITVRNYHEFDSGADGAVLAEAMMKEYGTREACIEEMVYITIVAAANGDRTTINALACIRKYWREHPPSAEVEALKKSLQSATDQVAAWPEAKRKSADATCD